MLQVVFARPGELHRRRRHRLGDLHGFGDVIRAAPASESAAQILGVDQALVGGQARDHRGGLLRQGLNLRGHPDIAAVGTHLNCRVQRLHGSVRKIRRFVHRFDFLGGAGEGGRGVACFAHGHARLGGQTRPFLPQSRCRYVGPLALVPLDDESLAAFHRAPGIVGNHGHAVRNLHDFLDARYGHRFRAVETRDLAFEHRAAFERGVQHAGTAHIESESDGAVNLRRSIQALGRRPDQFVLGGGLQRNVRRRGQFRRGFGQSAIGQFRAGRGIDHGVVLGPALRFIDLPLLGGGLHQHFASGRASLAQRLPRGADAQAAVSAHHRRAVHRLDTGELGADLLPVALQLLGQQLRERGHGALPHLRFVDLEGDGVVSAHLDEGVQLKGAGSLGLASHRQLEADEQSAAYCRAGLQEIACD